jgi:enoyl-CoA hydratase/carnithine racemase
MQIAINIPDNLPPAIVQEQIRTFENLNSAFMVMVSVCDGIWTAQCDALGLVTEAESYEELTERARQIAPELAELNNFGSGVVRLRFLHEVLS